MIKSLRIFIITLFFTPNLFSQPKMGEFEAVNGFFKVNQTSGYYLKGSSGYQINLQIGDRIFRSMYDSNLSLLNSYELYTQEYTLNQEFLSTPAYTQDLQFGKNNYEVYVDKKRLLVIAPDFEQKKDTVIFSQNLKNNERGEKRLALMAYSNGLRILCFSNKEDKLYLYQWQETGKLDTIEISLPKSSMSPEEIKKYTKYAKIKYNAVFKDMVVCKADEPSVAGIAGNSYVYYTEEKLWLVSQTPYYTGYNILEIDISKASISSSNYMINDMRQNVEAKKENIKKPCALIWQNNLIIRNSTYKAFQYQFYDMSTQKLIKKYSAEDEDSLNKIIHSDFNQKGTWLSGKGEKKIDNENAFIRKLADGDGFIIISKYENDSITITTGSIKPIQGIAGTIANAALILLSTGGNFGIGDFILSGYIKAFRDKLVYCHSRFSKDNFNLSSSREITTTLDNLLDNFEKRDLKSNSTILFKKGTQYMVAVYNSNSKKFELYTLPNDQDN